MGRRRQLSFAFVGIHRWPGDTPSAYSIINERAKGKGDRAGYPAVYDYTFAYGVSAAAAAATASMGYREAAAPFTSMFEG